MEDLLEAAQTFMPVPFSACEPRAETAPHEIRWWYERDGDRVLELEPLPRELLRDDPGEGGGGAGAREPRRPSPNAPSVADAIDPAA